MTIDNETSSRKPKKNTTRPKTLAAVQSVFFPPKELDTILRSEMMKVEKVEMSMGRGNVDKNGPALRIRKSLKSKMAIFKDQFFTPQKKTGSLGLIHHCRVQWDIFYG